MPLPKIMTFSNIFPIFVRKYETFKPNDQATIVEKMNDVINTMNEVGRVSNSVISNWNVVMDWMLNEGLNEVTKEEIMKLTNNGETLTTASKLINLGDGITDRYTYSFKLNENKDGLIFVYDEV